MTLEAMGDANIAREAVTDVARAPCSVFQKITRSGGGDFWNRPGSGSLNGETYPENGQTSQSRDRPEFGVLETGQDFTVRSVKTLGRPCGTVVCSD